MNNTLTSDQIAAFNKVTGWNTPTTPVAPASQSRADQIRAMGKPAVAPAAPTPNLATPEENTGQMDADQLNQAGNKITSSISTAGTRLAQDANGTIGGELKGVGDVAEGLGGAGAGIIQGIFAPVTASIQKLVQANSDSKGEQALATSAPVSAFLDATNAATHPAIQAVNDWAQKNPRAAEDLQNALIVGTTAIGGEGGLIPGGEMSLGDVASSVKGIGSDIADTAKTSAQAVKTAMVGTPEEQAAAKASAQAANATANQAKATQAIDTEIRNTAAKYPNTVGKKLNAAETVKGSDPIGVISSYPKGEALPTLVKGKLQTDGATSFLKTQVGKLADAKNNLNFLNENKVPIKDFQQRALDQVDAQQSWSAAKKTAAKNGINKIFDNEISPSYKDDLPMKELENLKQEQTGLSNSYSNAGAKPFELDAHGIIGKAARDIVNIHADGAPIDELNKLMQSHYDAIDLLNSMRGKTPHGGLISKFMGQTLGEIGGLGAGMTVGHPFLGAMAGRAGADFVDEIVNSHFISNPLKRMIVNNMPGVDSDVLNAANKYIEENSPELEMGNNLTPSKK